MTEQRICESRQLMRLASSDPVVMGTKRWQIQGYPTLPRESPWIGHRKAPVRSRQA